MGDAELMDMEEAVAWLRSRGVNASREAYRLGGCIFIPASPPLGTTIIHYEKAFYLYPGAGGSWFFLNSDGDLETSYPDLQSAAQAALDALKKPASS